MALGSSKACPMSHSMGSWEQVLCVPVPSLMCSGPLGERLWWVEDLGYHVEGVTSAQGNPGGSRMIWKELGAGGQAGVSSGIPFGVSWDRDGTGSGRKPAADKCCHLAASMVLSTQAMACCCPSFPPCLDHPDLALDQCPHLVFTFTVQ